MIVLLKCYNDKCVQASGAAARDVCTWQHSRGGNRAVDDDATQCDVWAMGGALDKQDKTRYRNKKARKSDRKAA